LRSYSKKPPKRGDALSEVFELAFEQIDFHTFPVAAAGAAAVAFAMLTPRRES
jgi:hypothetical protein